MVYWLFEKPLDLIRMQIHSNDSGRSGGFEHFGHEFCSNWHSGFVFAVLSCPAKIRQDGSDMSCRSPLGRIEHKEHFHKVIAVGKGRPYNKDPTAANRLFK